MYALIDNATLTAVQRVSGQVLVKNTDTVNGDLVALENLVQAILFYDQLVCIDNYKEEHREARKSLFDFIRFIPPNELGLDLIEAQAATEARAIRPVISGGEFADQDFKAFLEQLRMNVVCTWDKRSSVYYLTMKMLGQPNTPEWEKYGEISSAIFNELADTKETRGRWSADVKLISSQGVEISKHEMEAAEGSSNSGLGGLTRPLELFIASLNWLAYKSIYYSLASKYLKADSFLHPIRHAFQIHWMRKSGAFGHDFTSRLVRDLSTRVSTSVADVIDAGRSVSLGIDLPIFSAWIASQTGDPSKVISTALEITKQDEFRVVREILREIRSSYDSEGIAAGNMLAQRWAKDLEAASARVKAKYGIGSGQGLQGSHFVQVINSILATKGLPSFPEIDFKVPLPEWLQSKRTSSFSAIYKDVTRELTSIERLGGIRDLLASRFNIDPDGYSSKKHEDPKYRYRSSHWKIPM